MTRSSKFQNMKRHFMNRLPSKFTATTAKMVLAGDLRLTKRHIVELF